MGCEGMIECGCGGVVMTISEYIFFPVLRKRV